MWSRDKEEEAYDTFVDYLEDRIKDAIENL